MQNGNADHVFRFTNAGTAPLLITSAFSSCCCVVPEWPKEPLAPKASGSVKVRYNTGKAGPFTKVIVVKTNDAEAPKTVLRINGVVIDGKHGRTELRKKNKKMKKKTIVFR